MKHTLFFLLLCGSLLTARAQTGPGNALQIAGTVNYVAVPHTASFNSLPITVMAWVNTSTTTGLQGLVNKYVDSSFNGWTLNLRDGRVRAWYFVSSTRNVWGGGEGLDGGFIADGRWHHVVFMVDSTGAVIFVDGAQTASRGWTGASGSATTTQEVRIGSYPGNSFVGTIFIDDVSVWNTTLTGPQIRTSRDGGLTGLEGNRLAYFLCNESSGTTVADSAPLGGNNNGTWSGLVLFTPVTPSIRTLPASALDYTQATLNGLAIPNRSSFTVGFQWGATTNYGNSKTVSTLGGPSATTDQNYSLTVTGLAFATTHHFRAFASNSGGFLFGQNQSFRTLGPSAETLPASGVTQAAATLNGVVNPGGSNTTAWFEFGSTTNYGNVTPPQAVGSGTSSTNFSEAITGLIPGVFYHFRAVVSNSVTVVFGGDQSFPRLAQRDYVKASDSRAFQGFGRGMAMSGDTLVVGGGDIYIYVRQGDSWVEQARLFASGSVLAVSGDTLVVGGPGDDNNSTTTFDAGAAYVFVRSGTTWAHQVTLRASNMESFDNFGQSVAVSGDTIVVGAPFEDSNATGVNGNQSNNSASSAGAAYVFTRSGTTWSQQAYLKASNAEANDEFGGAVTISGDTVVVGADSESSRATGINGNQNTNDAFRAGAAYAFVRNGTTWSQQAYIKASNTGSSDHFGRSISMEGDTLVVGAVEEDSNASGVNGTGTDPNSLFNAGAAYVYLRSGGVWSQQAYLKASNPGSNDLFGTSVAVSGDNIIVGAVGERSNATGINGDGTNDLTPGAGAAYFFTREGTTWTFRDYLKASNTESNDHFGVAVTASGGFFVAGANGEDSSTTGVNGEQDNNGATNSGAAYVFGPPLPPSPEINVSQSGTNLLHGAVIFGNITAIGTPVTRGFTIKNTGNDFLTGLTVTFDGADAAAFSVILAPVAPLAPTSNTTFSVRFAPTTPRLINATLRIASNDLDENPFNLVLTGQSLSFTRDQDGDGLNDAAEFLMEPLGFDFQVSQTNAVSTLFSNANGAGLFTPSQLQALNVGAPLLTKDPNTGLFTLTIGVEKATQLTNFFPFPMTAPQTLINAEGKLEFQFSSPSNAAFFRLEAR